MKAGATVEEFHDPLAVPVDNPPDGLTAVTKATELELIEIETTALAVVITEVVLDTAGAE